MAVDNFLVMPVDRMIKPLVVRRSGVHDQHQQKEHEYPGQSNSERKKADKPVKDGKKMLGCLFSEHKIDCRI